MKRLLLLMLLSLWMTSSQAHPLAPALLEIQQEGPEHYELLWRLSAVQVRGIAPQPILPAACRRSSEISMTRETGMAVTSRWQIHCDTAGLTGQTFSIEGLDQNPINVVLRVKHENGQLFQTLLDADTAAVTIPAAESSSAVFNRYVLLGIEHLVFGPDHLLFLLALILLIGMRKKLVWVLTAFTLGHSITLSLASLGLVKVNAGLMEFGIAVTLVIAARELIGNRSGWLGRHPAPIAALFGLLHGLGFAGALSEVGLPQNDLFWALLAFNLGIEVAQLMIVLGLWTAVRLWNRPPATGLSPALPAYLIGSLAMFWCIERIGVF